jgi:hypothetical protein
VRTFVHERRLFARTSDGEEVELLPLSTTRYFVSSSMHELEFELDPGKRTCKARLKTARGSLEALRSE